MCSYKMVCVAKQIVKLFPPEPESPRLFTMTTAPRSGFKKLLQTFCKEKKWQESLNNHWNIATSCYQLAILFFLSNSQVLVSKKILEAEPALNVERWLQGFWVRPPGPVRRQSGSSYCRGHRTSCGWPPETKPESWRCNRSPRQCGCWARRLPRTWSEGAREGGWRWIWSRCRENNIQKKQSAKVTWSVRREFPKWGRGIGSSVAKREKNVMSWLRVRKKTRTGVGKQLRL